jgi:WS/DGAT/MGAT family acyltransferase
MSVRDAGFLYLERPEAGLHIACLALFERDVSLEALIQRVEARLPRLPRYTQRAVPAPFGVGHPTWEDDPDFDLHEHVRRWSLPAPGGESELVALASALFELPLARSRPLWEMHLIQGLDGDRCALLQKVHHCMVDGMAGAQILETLLDAEPSAPDAVLSLPRSRRRVRPQSGLVGALVDGARAQARGVSQALGALARPTSALAAADRLRRAAFAALQLATDDVPVMPWNAPIGPHRSLAFTRLPLEAVRRVRRVRGGTVNDVVLTAIAGGLRRYLEGVGVATRGLELTALVPVSLRSAEEAQALGNRISAMLVPLAVDPSDEIPRLAATRAITDRLKRATAWTGIDALLAALDGAPPALVALASAYVKIGRLANLIATNVPGPRETRWLGDARVDALYPLVPIAGGIGLGVAVFSYDGWLHVGLNADARRRVDLEKLRRAIEDAFQALAASA